ncbi:hypothetical protein [Psychrobacillus sp. MER TA 171]|uniref:hypothetical protein n=1 Tax=Psychrobacillus sp. MER TA 171 TaxID=2939577 RepID=UPI00204257BF|nr:hypothetical protein [Psychrobacillus sp. MER TA 171]MCM3358071.1 hypothetical protein [Psychrobacillus sp. MER TA 171]
MKKSNSLFVLFLFFLLFSSLSVSAQETNSSKIMYQGESENWKGDFTIEISEGAITKLGKIKYKGKDVDSVGQVSCTYETIAGTTSTKALLAGLDSIDSPIGEKGTLSSKSVIGNSNLYSKIDVIQVTVNWDGKTESFDLYK